MRKPRKLAAISLAALALVFGFSLLLAPAANAQATISSGSIQGTILDPNGASVPTAKVFISSKATGQKINPEVTSSGDYNSGPLLPGVYTIRVDAAGFKAIEKTVTVQVGTITSGTISLELGSGSTVVTVEASTVELNTDQATVQAS